MIANDMIDFIKSDLSIFGLLVFLIFGFLLYFFFRDIKLALIPLLNAALVIYTTSSILGYADWKISVVSSNFIALLLILTISISVHVIERFVELKKEDLDERLVIKTFSQMFIPCFFAVLTTGVAFLSLTFGELKPVIEFGKMMAFGITIAFILTFTKVQLLPVKIVALNSSITPWWSLSAAALVSVAPLIIVAFIVERYLSKGNLSGALK